MHTRRNHDQKKKEAFNIKLRQHIALFNRRKTKGPRRLHSCNLSVSTRRGLTRVVPSEDTAHGAFTPSPLGPQTRPTAGGAARWPQAQGAASLLGPACIPSTLFLEAKMLQGNMLTQDTLTRHLPAVFFAYGHWPSLSVAQNALGKILCCLSVVLRVPRVAGCHHILDSSGKTF